MLISQIMFLADFALYFKLLPYLSANSLKFSRTIYTEELSVPGVISVEECTVSSLHRNLQVANSQ